MDLFQIVIIIIMQKEIEYWGRARMHSTDFESRGMILKPDGNNGASSGNISSMGAKTSSEQAPTAFSSTPLHICQNKNGMDHVT